MTIFEFSYPFQKTVYEILQVEMEYGRMEVRTLLFFEEGLTM